MANQQLIDYIRESLKEGLSKEVIRNNLITNNWSVSDIDEAFKTFESQTSPLSSISPQLPTNQASGDLLKAGKLLKNAWKVYIDHFGTFIGIELIAVFPWLAVILLGFFVQNIAPSILIIITAILLGIAIVVLSLWSGLALYYAIKDRNENIGIRESFKRAWGWQILSFLWVAILTVFVILGGFSLAIVPGIIFGVWFYFGTIIFVYEGHKGFGALLRAKEYVQGKWWNIAWRLILISLIIGSVIGLVAYVSSAFAARIGQLVFYLLDSIIYPFLFAYLFLLYENLRQTRPELINQPISGKKGFFILSAILGLILPIILGVGMIYYNFSKDSKKMSNDVKRIANIRETQVVLEDYYTQNSHYPLEHSWQTLKVEMRFDLPNDPFFPKQNYTYASDLEGQDYVMAAVLEDKTNVALKSDVDGNVYGVNCDDPVYCVKFK